MGDRAKLLENVPNAYVKTVILELDVPEVSHTFLYNVVLYLQEFAADLYHCYSLIVRRLWVVTVLYRFHNRATVLK